jgi:hypothetical protein
LLELFADGCCLRAQIFDLPCQLITLDRRIASLFRDYRHAVVEVVLRFTKRSVAFRDNFGKSPASEEI